MEDYKKIETFIDRYGNAFDEYISSVVNKLSDTDSEYDTIEKQIANLYKENPEISVLIEDFSRLQAEYEQIEVVYDKSVVVTDQDKKTTTIDAPATVKITAEQVRRIADIVKQIRKKII